MVVWHHEQEANDYRKSIHKGVKIMDKYREETYIKWCGNTNEQHFDWSAKHKFAFRLLLSSTCYYFWIYVFGANHTDDIDLDM